VATENRRRLAISPPNKKEPRFNPRLLLFAARLLAGLLDRLLHASSFLSKYLPRDYLDDIAEEHKDDA
jgi:hypothetical protein